MTNDQTNVACAEVICMYITSAMLSSLMKLNRWWNTCERICVERSRSVGLFFSFITSSSCVENSKMWMPTIQIVVWSIICLVFTRKFTTNEVFRRREDQESFGFEFFWCNSLLRQSALVESMSLSYIYRYSSSRNPTDQSDRLLHMCRLWWSFQCWVGQRHSNSIRLHLLLRMTRTCTFAILNDYCFSIFHSRNWQRMWPMHRHGTWLRTVLIHVTKLVLSLAAHHFKWTVVHRRGATMHQECTHSPIYCSVW